MQSISSTRELFQKSLNYYQAYVDSLPLSNEIKEILKSDGINHASYYLFYPQLFKDAFYIKDSEKINLLGIAGFLFYKSLIYVDKIVDGQVASENKSYYFQLSLICQEESIKILATLFPLHNDFWKYWNARRIEYISAQKADREDYFRFTQGQFYDLADYKSAFGKVAIDSLALMANERRCNKTYQSLLQSHRHFSIGRQLYDDITDIREDFVNKQSNYAIYRLKQVCENNGIDFNKLDPVYLEKYAYVLGVSEEVLNEAIQHFQQAITVSKDYVEASSAWIETIRAYTQITKQLHIKQSTYLKQIKSQTELSDKRFGTQRALTKIVIEDRIKIGLNFLNTKLSESGFWEEYINSAGSSNIWATSFISSFIFDIEQAHDLIDFEKIKRFLLSVYRAGFSYNEIAPRDGDSTNFGLLALTLMGVDVKEKIPTWLKYQDAAGGFSTYIREDRVHLAELMNANSETGFGLWEAPQVCVSSVALYLMYRLSDKYDLHSQVNLLKKFILVNQKESMWESYWWTSPLYSCSFILRTAFENRDADLKSASLATVKKIIGLQNKNGSYGDPFSKESAFYTGLFVDSLCRSGDILSLHCEAIEASIKWLMTSQFRDGSWLQGHAMRLPSYRITDISEIKSWPVSRTGLNVRAVEFNRLFSTVVCISALNSYAKFRY